MVPNRSSVSSMEEANADSFDFLVVDLANPLHKRQLIGQLVNTEGNLLSIIVMKINFLFRVRINLRLHDRICY